MALCYILLIFATKYFPMKRSISLKVAVLAVVAAMFSCGHEQKSESHTSYADSVVNTCFRTENFDRLMVLVDSFQQTGDFTPEWADFIRGAGYDMIAKKQVTEHYWEKLYSTTDPEKYPEFYYFMAGRLSQLRLTMSNYQGSIEVAIKALEYADEHGGLSDDLRMTLLWSVAVSQQDLGLKEAEASSLKVYDMLEKLSHGPKDCTGKMFFATGLTDYYTRMKQYDKANQWLLKAKDNWHCLNPSADSLLYHEYIWQIGLVHAKLLEAQGNSKQAKAIFKQIEPEFTRSPYGLSAAAEYLLENKKYTEAADYYTRVDARFHEDHWSVDKNLDFINNTLIPRLKANIGAGRKDSVVSMARFLADHYEQALDDERKNTATQLAIIYDTQGKEKQIAEQEASLMQQRIIGLMVAIVLLTIFFIVYSLLRRRAANLKAAKDRIESELRIARDIQMSMVPSSFPDREGLDMYAQMTPAKEVGGDLYGYVLIGDRLYFAVGDVSGKGVPASLFMAQATRLFRTMATQGLMPAEICTRMNNELSGDDNVNGMFVTMFLGMLNMETGHLYYCNAGHNPPVIGGGENQGEFLEMIANAPIGLFPELDYEGEEMASVKGRALFVYTDGLNEAEDMEQNQFGDDHLLEILRNTHFESARQVVEMLYAKVQAHRNGAEPNDDLTMMCLRVS